MRGFMNFVRMRVLICNGRPTISLFAIRADRSQRLCVDEKAIAPFNCGISGARTMRMLWASVGKSVRKKLLGFWGHVFDSVSRLLDAV